MVKRKIKKVSEGRNRADIALKGEKGSGEDDTPDPSVARKKATSESGGVNAGAVLGLRDVSRCIKSTPRQPFHPSEVARATL